MFECPVCGYDRLWRPAEDFLICPSCGTEFGYHDAQSNHTELRNQWLRRGAIWSSPVIPPPPNWDAYNQLVKANLLQPTGTANASSTIASLPPPYVVWGSYRQPIVHVPSNAQEFEAELVT